MCKLNRKFNCVHMNVSCASLYLSSFRVASCENGRSAIIVANVDSIFQHKIICVVLYAVYCVNTTMK